MNAMLEFVSKMGPAMLYVGLGYCVRLFTPLKQRAVANFLFYGLVPVIVFRGAAFSDIAKFSGIALFSFAFGGACAMASYPLRATFVKHIKPGMLMSLFSCFNIGWFGIPLVLAVLGEDAARVMTALYVGGTLYGNTVGYVLASDTAPTVRQVIRKLASIPALYGFAAALAIQPFAGFMQAVAHSRSMMALFDIAALLTSLCGMGLVGMSMVGVNARSYLAPVAKLLGLRLVVTSTLIVASLLLSLLVPATTQLDRHVVAMLPCLPIAANLLVFVSKKHEEAHFVGFTLFASTLLSFLLLPLVFFLQYG